VKPRRTSGDDSIRIIRGGNSTRGSTAGGAGLILGTPMPWIIASLLSAVFLGFYELGTKHAVNGNAVLPVLFIGNVLSAGLWLLLMAVQAAGPHLLPGIFTVAPIGLLQHAQIVLKSLIVGAAWTCTYFAVKHLPVSISSPIRATGPVGTLLGAVIFLGERPAELAMLGVVVTLASFIALSFAGRQEGVNFFRNPWIGWLVAGTAFNAASALYDKILFGRAGFQPATVQAWFSIYLAVLFLPLAIGWKLRWWPRQQFHWRWSIPFLSAALLVADFLYFGALRDPDALVSLVSGLRRGSTLVAFAGGIAFFGERSGAAKAMAVAGVLLGIVLTVTG
jgi:drug/metabolite transporter (DMT)-like permease